MRSLFSGVSFLILCILVSGGCSSSDMPKLGLVTGSILENGKPIPHVLVEFYPDIGRPSSGATDENGQYELSYNPDAKGAAIGFHKVFFTIPGKSAEAGFAEVTPGNEKPVAAAKGGPPKPFEWKSPVEVQLGKNEFNFNMEEVY